MRNKWSRDYERALMDGYDPEQAKGLADYAYTMDITVFEAMADLYGVCAAEESKIQ